MKRRLISHLLPLWAVVILMAGCRATRSTESALPAPPPWQALEDSLRGGHLGIYITEAETGRVIADYHGSKYFVPASNTKLLSLYAGLRHLGDSLVGAWVYETRDTFYFKPAGDPTLLHPDYLNQPLLQRLTDLRKPSSLESSPALKFTPYGRGWPWSDFDASYAPPRSALPVYGHMVRFTRQGDQLSAMPAWFAQPGILLPQADDPSNLRSPNGNIFYRPNLMRRGNVVEVPFADERNYPVAAQLLLDTVRRRSPGHVMHTHGPQRSLPYRPLYSQPTDSMLRPMMYRSDNFFAEQTLLMASQAFLGYLSDRDMIDTLLKTELRGMPDPPVWADGSGLSRYNMLTPRSFVWLLDKMRREFPMQRLQAILPTGNTGTLGGYYRDMAGKMFMKTGTLSGQVALSGYMYARSGKLLLFSVLVNNHNTAAPAVRRAVERYLMGIWEQH